MAVCAVIDFISGKTCDEDRHTPRWALKEEREHEAGNPGPDSDQDQEVVEAQGRIEDDTWDYDADGQIIIEFANNFGCIQWSPGGG